MEKYRVDPNIDVAYCDGSLKIEKAMRLTSMKEAEDALPGGSVALTNAEQFFHCQTGGALFAARSVPSLAESVDCAYGLRIGLRVARRVTTTPRSQYSETSLKYGCQEVLWTTVEYDGLVRF